MNNLSWLIYAADVCRSFGTVLTIISFASLVVAVAAFGSHAISIDSLNFKNSFSDDPKLPVWGGGLKAARPFVISFIATAVVASIIPSRETVYAVAASEMGERAVASETGGKAVKALNAWLDRQIAEPAKKN